MTKAKNEKNWSSGRRFENLASFDVSFMFREPAGVSGLIDYRACAECRRHAYVVSLVLYFNRGRWARRKLLWLRMAAFNIGLDYVVGTTCLLLPTRSIFFSEPSKIRIWFCERGTGKGRNNRRLAIFVFAIIDFDFSRLDFNQFVYHRCGFFQNEFDLSAQNCGKISVLTSEAAYENDLTWFTLEVSQ